MFVCVVGVGFCLLAMNFEWLSEAIAAAIAAVLLAVLGVVTILGCIKSYSAQSELERKMNER